MTRDKFLSVLVLISLFSVKTLRISVSGSSNSFKSRLCCRQQIFSSSSAAHNVNGRQLWTQCERPHQPHSFSCIKAVSSVESDIPSSTSNSVSKYRLIASSTVRHIMDVVGPLALNIAIMAFFYSFASPAFAAEAKKKALQATAGKAGAMATVEKVPLWRKILEGATYSGKSRKAWKAGDTRGEIAALLNSVSSIVILGVAAFFAFLIQKQREFSQGSAFTKELVKVKEYKENMYFDAVEDILGKLNDPKLKGSTKARLQKELRELDPQGVIQSFIASGGNRPDISDLIDTGSSSGRSKGKNSNNRSISSGGSKGNKPLKKPSSAAKRSPTVSEETISKNNKLSNRSTSNDNNDDNNDDDESDASEPYVEVLVELFDSLEGAMPSKTRKLLVENLKARLDKTKDPAKRAVVAAKIAERIGSNGYWIEYAQDNL